MKIDRPLHIIAILGFLIMCFLISGCDDKNTVAEIDRADAIIDEYPDSALSILSRIDTSTLRSSEAKNRYNLLDILARFKTGENLSTDSIINEICLYYDSDDRISREKMLSHYLMAHSELNYNHDSIASHHFEEVITIGKIIKDRNYPAMAEASLGVIDAQKGLTEESINHYLSSIDYLDKNNGLTKYKILSHISLADLYGSVDNIETAMLHADMAKRISLSDGVQDYLGKIAETSGVLYFYSGQMDKACEEFEKADTSGKAISYRNLTYWIMSSFETDRPYAMDLHKKVKQIPCISKAENLSRLIMERYLAARSGEFKQEADYSDSIMKCMDQKEVSDNDRPQLKNESYKGKRKGSHFTLYCMIAACVIVVPLFIFINKKIDKSKAVKIIPSTSETVDICNDSPECKTIETTTSNHATLHFDKEKARNLIDKYSNAISGLRDYADLSSSEGENIVRNIRRKINTRKFQQNLKNDVDAAMSGIYSMLIRDLQLKESERRMVLYILCGFSYREISCITGDLPTTVSSQLSRLKKKIRMHDGPNSYYFKECLDMLKKHQ